MPTPEYLKSFRALARHHLKPLGFKQNRTYGFIADRGWYMLGIDCPPSHAKHGGFLRTTVFACWLWVPKDHESLDLTHPLNRSFDYINPEHWHRESESRMHEFVAAVNEIDAACINFQSLANYRDHIGPERALPFNDPWQLYHRAVIAGLAGDLQGMRSRFDAVLAGRLQYPYEHQRAKDISKLYDAQSPDELWTRIKTFIKKSRIAMKLPAVDLPNR